MYDIPIERLLPQRPPFVLVDGIKEHETAVTKAHFLIPKDHILIEHGKLSAYGLLENMAQAAALRSGYESLEKGENPKTGFIGTITNAIVHALPEAGTEVITTVHQTNQILNFILIECTAKSGDLVLAECAMKIVLLD